MGHQIIDQEHWDRKPLMDYYEDFDLPYIIMSAEVDVTKALKFAHEHDISFNLVMVYLANKTADSIINFRYRFKGKEAFLIEYNRPEINHLIPGTENFVAAEGVWPCDDIVEFCKQTHARFAGLSAYSFVEAVEGKDDIINYSAIPWVHYTHFFRTIRHAGKDNNPKISFGKYSKEGGRVMMPVSVQTHHALMDGQHVGQFFTKLQKLAEELD